MEAIARSRHIRQSARKLRQVADLIRGKDIETALNILHFSNKKSAEIIEKTVRAGVANLLNTDDGANIEPENLYLKTIFVDEGATARRFQARAMGRAYIIRKRSSHITVKVADKNSNVKTN